MKLLTTVTSLLGATLVTARVTRATSGQTVIANDNLKVPGNNPLTYCEDPSNYYGTIDYVNLTPNPPVPGEKLSIAVSGTLDKDIDDGSIVHLTVKYGPYITLINQDYSLCDQLLPKIDEKCPLKAGQIKIERDADIPNIIPPGQYNVFANVLSKDGTEIVCMNAVVTF